MRERIFIAGADGGSGRYIWGAVLSVLLLILLPATYYGYACYDQNRLGPEQPIPFSHQVHAGDKRISCLFCHETVATDANAGLPPLETCLLCHSRIVTHLPPIATLRQKFFNGQPVAWQRVKYAGPGNYLPDFVFFNHAVHIRRSIDCGHCHGPVNTMDRISRVQDLHMGFCVGCHKHYNASHDCYACHR